jgi:hypothetical protein
MLVLKALPLRFSRLTSERFAANVLRTNLACRQITAGCRRI